MYRAGSRKRRSTIGDYERLTLADARSVARDVLHRAAMGEDPGTEKINLRNAETFGELAAVYLERHAKVNKRSWRDDERMLKADVLPNWGALKTGEIRRRDVIALLDQHVTRGAPILANRVLALVRKMFNFALQRDLIEFNPCQAVSRPTDERPRQGQRVLNFDEIRAVWRSMEQEEPLVSAIFKLRLLTAQRGSEIRSMEWSEVDFESSWWTIPGSKTKNKLDHRVPITDQMTQILRGVSHTKENSKFVFPSPIGAGRSINHIQKAFQRIKGRTEVEFWDRDLRRTAASHMTGELGIPRLVVSKILNHVESSITRVYDRHAYDREKREALASWNALVTRIISSSYRSNLVRLESAAGQTPGAL